MQASATEREKQRKAYGQDNGWLCARDKAMMQCHKRKKSKLKKKGHLTEKCLTRKWVNPHPNSHEIDKDSNAYLGHGLTLALGIRS